MTRIVAKIVTLEEDSKGAAVAKDLAMCCTSPGEEEDGDRCPIETLLGVRAASEPKVLFILPATALCAETD